MNNTKKEYASMFGLLLITVWSAVQYVFLQNVPDTVSTFSFMFVTYLAGLVILVAIQVKKLRLIHKETLLKGLLLAGELTGFNFFLIIGSRGVDSVIVSSLLSMYFIFVTPLLLLLKKKVSFRSAVASAVAIIALLLMFNAELDAFFDSPNVIFLLIGDLFFAVYVITISIVGEKEDSAALTISQTLCSVLFCCAGWCVEVLCGQAVFRFPGTGNTKFWISVLFFGIFIRAFYGLIQMSCQKNVKPVNASLIFSSEIIITLITNPFMSKLMNTGYTPATNYQIVGCILFVVAVLVVDDTIMGYMGYKDMDAREYVDENGVTRTQSTLSKKMTNTTLVISMLALVSVAVICLASIFGIKQTSVDKSTELGHSAANISEDALKSELERQLMNTVLDKSALAEEKLRSYLTSARYVADYAAELYNNSYAYGSREVNVPQLENAGIWAMQRAIANTDILYSDLEKESKLMGNLEPVFHAVISHSDNIAAIYIGTKTGLMVSYDTYSADTDVGVENYYEFRESEWYMGSAEKKEPFFTQAYQDNYGRGLTITCVAPIIDRLGRFRGCVCIDLLMNDINRSMVNDNIVDPNYATLIDDKGFIIASKGIDGETSGTVSIYDKRDLPIGGVADTVLSKNVGLAESGTGETAVYIAFSKIDLTNWVLCIMSPVSESIRPAVTIRETIDGNTKLVTDAVNDSVRTVINSCLVLIAVVILIITYFVGKQSEKMTTPLQNLESDVLEISDGHFDQRTKVTTDDEIGSLARAFNHMTESLQQYIVNLKDMTAREERIASELSVATKIQTDMLPKNFDDLLRSEFDIYATMNPAKEVGGDFYDFFFVDDDHFAMVIADVSGKGVPAALFMMTSKTLLKSAAQGGLSPKAVLEKVNNQLCENNEAEMFVTVWLGILEISTGRLVCGNAGHEYPVLKRNGGVFELYKDKHGLVLAGMEDMQFSEYELRLSAGDTLFVYTDGVAEATDEKEELYGTDRLVAALNGGAEKSCRGLLDAVLEDVNRFIGEAPQFDDITMLCFTYKKA